jgi:opacity protein-like surface antigen
MKSMIALCMILASAAVAADVSGKWTGTFKVNGGDHTVPQLFILQQQGKKLTGSGGPNEGEQYPIENGTNDGGRVRFQLTTGEWKFAYDLKQTGEDGLEGDLKLENVNDSRTAAVSLRRLK